MNKTNIAIWVAVIAFAVSIVGLYTPVGQQVTQVIKELGSASSPSIVDGCMELGAGGPTLCSYKVSMRAASTTCSFLTTIASSTLIRAVARVEKPYGGTFDLEFGKSANVMSTTTSLGYFTGITSGITLQASTSPLAFINSPTNFTAGQYLNVKIGTTSVSNISGTCTAMFMSI